MTGTESFLRTFADPGAALLQQADAAVVMTSILRPTVVEALASVLRQDFAGKIHVLVGLDVPGDIVQALWPGFSTSVRHGGSARRATEASCGRC